MCATINEPCRRMPTMPPCRHFRSREARILSIPRGPSDEGLLQMSYSFHIYTEHTIQFPLACSHPTLFYNAAHYLFRTHGRVHMDAYTWTRRKAISHAFAFSHALLHTTENQRVPPTVKISHRGANKCCANTLICNQLEEASTRWHNFI